MRVLIIKTLSMGDVLHTLPALVDAAQAIPDIHFDWVVEEGFAQIPSWHESVERVIPVAICRWHKAWFSAPIRTERQAFREVVQAVKYGAIINAQGLVKSAVLVTRLAHGVKHGIDWQTAREPLANLFYSRRHYIAKQQHTVERTRELFVKSPGYAKPQTQGDYAVARHFLQHEASAAALRLVSLHAITRDDKYWPETRWQELLDLLADSGVRIKLPWGAPHEEVRAKRLAEGREYIKVLPHISLEQVTQVLASARTVVSVDTGLSHLTAALDKPNFTLHGPTDPGLIGGYDKSQHIVRPENSTSTSDIPASRVHLLLQNQGLL